ncbi:MAG: hypothetical protein IJW46_03995 [Clostridia bacterium]|nr:hypothetical protein [Clostridia bacterium]
MKLSFASKYMYHTATVKGGFSIRPVLFCGEISACQEKRLCALGYTVRRLPPFSRLDKPVRCHPDMLIAPLPSGKLLLSRAYYEEHPAFFAPFLDKLVLSEDSPQKRYPEDVLFNALPVGETLFGGNTVSQELRCHYPHFVPIRQGYTHCAAASVGRGIITADRSLYTALTEHGVDALLITPGAITLSPYDTGFIGGASLALSERLTVFFGRLNDHPDYQPMLAFAKRQNATLLSLSDEPLTDCGGGYLLYHDQTPL